MTEPIPNTEVKPTSDPAPSTESKPKPCPLVDDAYYYNYGKDLFDNTLPRLNTTAEKLEKFILWLWGIYTPVIGLGSGFVQFFTNIKFSYLVYGLLLVPVFLLMLAYRFSLRVQSSWTGYFDPNSPGTVFDFHENSINFKEFNLKVTNFFVYLSILAIPLALFLALSNIKPPDAKIEWDFQTKLTYDTKLDKTRITINGKIPEKLAYKIILKSGTSEKLEEFEFPPSNDGIVQVYFDISNKPESVKITLEWTTEKSSIISIGKLIKQ